MASATWLRLLKLDLALIASRKPTPQKTRRRRHRPRLAAEQLEDRTLPSAGIAGPAAHQPPTSPLKDRPRTGLRPPRQMVRGRTILRRKERRMARAVPRGTDMRRATHSHRR
jgi:hypothetical protein